MSDRVEEIRRTLEGVIGVPATEGNRIEVLRNGDEIFPAMLDAISEAEHTIDFLTFVYWSGEIGTEFARRLAARGASRCARARAPRRVGRAPDGPRRDRRDGRGRRPPAVVSTHAQAPARFREPPHAPEGARGRRVDRVHRRRRHRRRVEGRRAQRTRVARHALPHPRARGRRVAGRVPRQLGRDRSGALRRRHRPLPGPTQTGRARSCSACGVRPRRGGATSPPCSARCCNRRASACASRPPTSSPTRRSPSGSATRPTAACRCRSCCRARTPTSDWCSSPREATYNELLEHGIELWSFQPSMMHAKVMTIDGVVANIGSANLNSRSTACDEEINVVALDPELVRMLDEHFDADLERSVQIKEVRWERRTAAPACLGAPGHAAAALVLAWASTVVVRDGDRCPADPRARGAGRSRVPAHHRRSRRRTVRRGRRGRRPRRRTGRRRDRGDTAGAARSPGHLLPRAVADAGAAGAVQPPLRTVQPGAVRRAARRSSRGDRGRPGTDRADRTRLRRLVALGLLVPARAADGFDPACDRSAAVRLGHDLGQPVPRVPRAVAIDAGRARRLARRPQRGQRVLAEDARDPRSVRGHDGADERGREPHAGAPRRPPARRNRTAGTVRQRAVHDRAGRLPSARVAVAARRTCSRTRPKPATRAAGNGPKATSRSGTTGACNTW